MVFKTLEEIIQHYDIEIGETGFAFSNQFRIIYKDKRTTRLITLCLGLPSTKSKSQTHSTIEINSTVEAKFYSYQWNELDLMPDSHDKGKLFTLLSIHKDNCDRIYDEWKHSKISKKKFRDETLDADNQFIVDFVNISKDDKENYLFELAHNNITGE